MGRYKDSVRTLLKQRGVDPDLLAVRSAGTSEPREQGNTEIARSTGFAKEDLHARRLLRW